MKKIIFKEKNILKIIRIITITFLIFLTGYYFSKNLVINPSDSIEVGIYRKTLWNDFSKGKYVMYIPKEKFQKYIKKDTSEKNKTITLLKKIAASEKDVVEIKDFVLYINGEEKGKLLKLKGLTEKSPNFKKILSKDEFFLLGETSDSFDSRYFGIVKKQDLISEIKIFLKGKDIEKALWWLK